MILKGLKVFKEMVSEYQLMKSGPRLDIRRTVMLWVACGGGRIQLLFKVPEGGYLYINLGTGHHLTEGGQ